jgi:nucleotide-binding universal stress UspA family protein
MPEKEFFRKILVAVNGSPISMAAQELTASIAKKFNSQVTVMHVVSHELMNAGMQDLTLGGADTDVFSAGITRGDFTIPTQLPRQPSTSPPKKMVSEITSIYREMGEQIVRNAVSLFQDEGISADEELVQDNDPAGTIVKEAELESYDLIVIGRSSGEAEKKPHLGSLASKVARHAKIPVLVVAHKNLLEKMLVPVDGSLVSKRAAKDAEAIAAKAGSKVTLLYVQEQSLFRMRPQLSERIGKQVLSTIAGQFENVKVEQKLESGHPGSVITRLADEENYDIIVMGSHGHSSARRVLLGNVSDQVLHYSNQSVLIVK